MPRLTIFHSSDIYEILYSENVISHIDKLIGDSQTRREVTFDKLPDQVQFEILQIINSDED